MPPNVASAILARITVCVSLVSPSRTVAGAGTPGVYNCVRFSGNLSAAYSPKGDENDVSEGGQSFDLYPITGSPHVDPMVLGYASSARALFQPDLYTPPSTMPAGPAAVHLAQSIRALNLRVDTMVGGHGGVGTYADFLKAAVPAPSLN
jgi:hypothetical protein